MISGRMLAFPGLGYDGPADVARAMFTFPDEEGYRCYRDMVATDPEYQSAAALVWEWNREAWKANDFNGVWRSKKDDLEPFWQAMRRSFAPESKISSECALARLTQPLLKTWSWTERSLP